MIKDETVNNASFSDMCVNIYYEGTVNIFN